ncbi:hypothetical protein J5N97_020407 [Dioscorea zingiberensis]|uniref:Uncharacterized protein n=1 Tax=Dioscorea zingiberensis TaxID=325984 RepID=A0A9D5CFT5_9LILI|nr:hypothetical protein J5N97_020407 [Dioscorea zingiberensis]
MRRGCNHIPSRLFNRDGVPCSPVPFERIPLASIAAPASLLSNLHLHLPVIHPLPSPKKRSEALAHGNIVGHPFDTIKVKLQAYNTNTQVKEYKNAWQCTSQILRTEGQSTKVSHAYDREAIKLRGVDADINFSLAKYEDYLKQMKNLTKEEFVHILR